MSAIMSISSSRLRALASCDGLAELAGEDLAVLAREIRPLRLHDGQPCSIPGLGLSYGWIVGGWLRVLGGEGEATGPRSVTVALADQGEGIALPSRRAVLEGAAVIAFLSATGARRACLDAPALAGLLLNLAGQAADDYDCALAYLRSPAPDRVTGLLDRLAERYGRVTPSGVRIDREFTQAELASMVGVTRETMAKEIGALRLRHLVSTDGSRMVWRGGAVGGNGGAWTPMPEPAAIAV